MQQQHRWNPGTAQLFEQHKVVEYQPDSKLYSLTTTLRAFLVPGEKSYAGDWILANADPDLWERMLQTIQSGVAASYSLPWAQVAWLESCSPSRAEYSLEMWRTVGVNPDPEQPLHIIDLACGCGIKTLAFAQAYENVHVTCVDSPSILEVARDTAHRLNVETQSTFTPADLLGRVR
jgi:methylase of polypeptide subunit release factors